MPVSAAPRADTNKVASAMLVIADPSAADVDLTAITTTASRLPAPRWAAQMLELTNRDAAGNAAIVLRPEGALDDGSQDVTITLVPNQVMLVRKPIKAIESTGSDADVQVVAYWWDPGGSTNWNK